MFSPPGIDSVYQAPSGQMIALGLILFETVESGAAANHPACGFLRGNPGNLEASGDPWYRVFTPVDPLNIHNTGYGMPSSQYEGMLATGDPVYFFVGGAQ